MYRHILIATDGSELGQLAVGQGLSLARALGAQATVMTATEPWNARATAEMSLAFPVEEYDKIAAANASSVLAGVSHMAHKIGISPNTLHVKERQPAEAIVETAKRLGCDLIVMSSHGRRGLTRMLLGSQANRVMIESPVPVMICR